MTAAPPPRRERRAGYDIEVRLSLLDDDIDAVLTQMANLDRRMARWTWMMLGATISAATAAVVFAANLVVLT